MKSVSWNEGKKCLILFALVLNLFPAIAFSDDWSDAKIPKGSTNGGDGWVINGWGEPATWNPYPGQPGYDPAIPGGLPASWTPVGYRLVRSKAAYVKDPGTQTAQRWGLEARRFGPSLTMADMIVGHGPLAFLGFNLTTPVPYAMPGIDNPMCDFKINWRAMKQAKYTTKWHKLSKPAGLPSVSTYNGEELNVDSEVDPDPLPVDHNTN